MWVFVGVCVCGCGMLICFVNALGSHEMGCHKLPIIIIIMLSVTDPGGNVAQLVECQVQCDANRA